MNTTTSQIAFIQAFQVQVQVGLEAESAYSSDSHGTAKPVTLCHLLFLLLKRLELGFYRNDMHFIASVGLFFVVSSTLFHCLRLSA